MVGIAWPAAAEGDATRLLERAKARYAAGAFADARTLLKQARAGATGQPALLGQIGLHLGLAHAADNQLDEARAAFRGALTHDPSLRIDPHRYKPALVETFDEVRQGVVADLEVKTFAERKDLMVFVDGKRAGAPPLTTTLTAGGHRVELRDPAGKVLGSRRVHLNPGTRTQVAVALDPAPPRTEPAADAPAAGEGRGTATAAPRRSARRNRGGRLRWTWVAAAATVTAAAVAVGFGLSAVDDRNEGCSLLADKSVPCEQRTNLVAPATSEQRYLDLRDAVSTKRTVSNVAWVATGVAAASTLLLFWVERSGRPARDEDDALDGEATLAPSLGPGSAGVTLRLGF